MKSKCIIVNAYKIKHIAANANIWHCKMGYIGPLKLYKLGKKYLEVKLCGKIILQCTHYTLLKISQ